MCEFRAGVAKLALSGEARSGQLFHYHGWYAALLSSVLLNGQIFSRGVIQCVT